MCPAKRIFVIIILTHALFFGAWAQVPVEVFAGHERATTDVMFFKFFKQAKKSLESRGNSNWLLFNRTRASIDYRMTKEQFLPQFGITGALSWNPTLLKGFAPVVVGQIFNSGVYPKAGIQYAHIKKELTVFSWVVMEMLKNPRMDYFLLMRFTPRLTERMNLFTQFESVNVFALDEHQFFSLTQRLRLGLKFREWQFGAGADFNQSGRKTFNRTDNLGGFIRYEF
jgi:hypothetical protein